MRCSFPLNDFYNKSINFILQVLVIFSDGLDENVMSLERESDLLRKSGKN